MRKFRVQRNLGPYTEGPFSMVVLPFNVAVILSKFLVAFYATIDQINLSLKRRGTFSGERLNTL